MDVSLMQGSKHAIMDEEEEENLGSFSSSLSDDSSGNSTASSSSSSGLTEDTGSSRPSSPSSSPASSCKGPLFEMSSLKEQLPFKRGLSKFYQGKSQSFTSFSDIMCLEDLAKPERPLKRLKSSKSCEDGLDSKRSLHLKCCNRGRTITKKASKGSSSLLSSSTRRNCLLVSKPPLYPHRPASNLADHTTLCWKFQRYNTE